MIRKMKWEMKDLKIGYEKKYDILGIIIPDKKYKIERTVEVEEGFLLDIDKKDKIVQLELHNVRNRLNVSSDYIKKAKIDVFIEVYDFSYVIIISFNEGEKEFKRRVLRGKDDELLS